MVEGRQPSTDQRRGGTELAAEQPQTGGEVRWPHPGELAARGPEQLVAQQGSQAAGEHGRVGSQHARPGREGAAERPPGRADEPPGGRVAAGQAAPQGSRVAESRAAARPREPDSRADRLQVPHPAARAASARSHDHVTGVAEASEGHLDHAPGLGQSGVDAAAEDHAEETMDASAGAEPRFGERRCARVGDGQDRQMTEEGSELGAEIRPSRPGRFTQ